MKQLKNRMPIQKNAEITRAKSAQPRSFPKASDAAGLLLPSKSSSSSPPEGTLLGLLKKLHKNGFFRSLWLLVKKQTPEMDCPSQNDQKKFISVGRLFVGLFQVASTHGMKITCFFCLVELISSWLHSRWHGRASKKHKCPLEIWQCVEEVWHWSTLGHGLVFFARAPLSSIKSHQKDATRDFRFGGFFFSIV